MGVFTAAHTGTGHICDTIRYDIFTYKQSKTRIGVFVSQDLSLGKYWVYPRMVYRLTIVMPRDNVWIGGISKIVIINEMIVGLKMIPRLNVK